MQENEETTDAYEAPQVTDVEDLLGLLTAGGSGPWTHALSVTN